MPGVGGDRGDDLDSDGPEPLATVGQLSSPRFASFFEPPLYTHEKRRSSSVELFQRRAQYMAFFAPAPPCRIYLGPGSDFPTARSPPSALRKSIQDFLYSGSLRSGNRDRYKLGE